MSVFLLNTGALKNNYVRSSLQKVLSRLDKNFCKCCYLDIMQTLKGMVNCVQEKTHIQIAEREREKKKKNNHQLPPLNNCQSHVLRVSFFIHVKKLQNFNLNEEYVEKMKLSVPHF